MIDLEETTKATQISASKWRIMVILKTRGTRYTKRTWPTKAQAEDKIARVQAYRAYTKGFRFNGEHFLWTEEVLVLAIPAGDTRL